MRTHSNESGFSLPELLIAMTIMLLISGAAVTATIARGFGGAMKASSTLVVLKANPF